MLRVAAIADGSTGNGDVGVGRADVSRAGVDGWIDGRGDERAACEDDFEGGTVSGNAGGAEPAAVVASLGNNVAAVDADVPTSSLIAAADAGAMVAADGGEASAVDGDPLT